MEQDYYVVGIGASAGGTAALKTLFTALPDHLDASFIVVRHLHPKLEDKSAGLLTTFTKMRVVAAKPGLTLRKNTVYLLPPGKMMTLSDGALLLREREENESINCSVDIFFKSMTRLGGRAIGIILSGNGGDGAIGLKAIHESGGITIVQDPQTALYPGMPDTAVVRDHPQFVLNVKQIAELLVELLKPASAKWGH